MSTKIRVSTSVSGVMTGTIVLSEGDVTVSRTERIGSTNIKGQIVAAYGRAVLTLGSAEQAMAEIKEVTS